MLWDKNVCTWSAQGFRLGLGYPLTSGLLLRFWNRIEDDRSFREALREVIEFHYPRFDPRKFSSFPNVEELLSQMAVNEQLFDSSRDYTGKFTKIHLRNLQRKLLLEISDWFHAISRKDLEKFAPVTRLCRGSLHFVNGSNVNVPLSFRSTGT